MKHNRAVVRFYKRNYKSVWTDLNAAQDLGYKVTPDFLDAFRNTPLDN